MFPPLAVASSAVGQLGRRVRCVLFDREIPIAPGAIVRHFLRYRDLIRQFTRREVIGRYEGSYLGILWSLLTPLLLLGIYTFVFGVVFQAQWGPSDQGLGAYGMTLYSGLIAFFMFSEVASSAPRIVTSNVNYVTRVVFPLEILPLIRVLGAVIRAGLSTLILITGLALILGRIPPTLVLYPVVLVPMFLLSVGVAYFFAFLGVFVPDLAHSIGLFIRIVTYMSPVFYPISRLPEWAQPIVLLNPIAAVIEDCRRVAVFGEFPDWGNWAVAAIVCATLAWVGYVVFMSSKKAFADVL